MFQMPTISAALLVIFLAMGRNITSCSFIARSAAFGTTTTLDRMASSLPPVKRTHHLLSPPDISCANDTKRSSSCRAVVALIWLNPLPRQGFRTRQSSSARGKGMTTSIIAEILEAATHLTLEKRAISNGSVLNEAYAYAVPSSFSRGIRVDLNGVAVLFISGTASIDENGKSVHEGDFRAQMRRTLANITGLLGSEGCNWHDVVRTTCYLRDIERDYAAFNEERTVFFREQGLDPLPASTGIQAILCRPELLVEIEAIAMFRTQQGTADRSSNG